MSTDLRNSIYLWAGGLAFFGLFWALVHFDVLGWIPPTWHRPMLWVLLAFSAVHLLWEFWRWLSSKRAKANGR